jgi:hypothetical protein
MFTVAELYFGGKPGGDTDPLLSFNATGFLHTSTRSGVAALVQDVAAHQPAGGMAGRNFRRSVARLQHHRTGRHLPPAH